MSPTFDADLWSSGISLEDLKARTGFIKKIRQFFDERDCLEVDTPSLSHFGVTDVNIENLSCHTKAFGELFLQSSPEYAMKRLLASHQTDIYQIARAFRDDQLGRKHNPEFCLLEWYRVGFDHMQLMAEVDELLQYLVNAKPAQQVTYQALFIEHCQLDIFSVTKEQLTDLAKQTGLTAELETKDDYLSYLFATLIEPKLGFDSPVLVYEYPAAQSALAKLKASDTRVAERFECFYQGLELANGFHELTDSDEQSLRFKADNQARKAQGKAPRDADPYLLKALDEQFPNCAGVALGVDRLLMLHLNKPSIAEVMPFTIERI